MVSHMENLECPRCREKSVSIWVSMLLGPFRTIICPNCGARIGVSAAVVWAPLPFIAAVVAAIALKGGIVAIAILLAGFAVSIWLQYRFVTLVVR
jgi:hypothetical protein